MTPIPDLEDRCVAIDSGMTAAYVAPAVIASTSTADGLEIGVHEHVFPTGLRHLPELLVLAGNPDLRLLVLTPAANIVGVFPQDWYNQRDFDLGYQWVTRVAREPQARSIVSEASALPSRLRAFAPS